MEKPSEKDKRYDRQLRLWGDHGQRTLESSHVCLINATGAGTETLKNLVLPGIGSFTIIDSEVITSRDLGSNFFVTSERVGSNRGVTAAELLSELNSTVNTNVCTEPLGTIIENSPDYFNQFNIVIATGIPLTDLHILSELLWQRNIPLLIVRAYGLIGYVRLVISSHEVIESHPDNSHEDLRLDCPFESLRKYVDSIDIDSLDNTHHANLPYLVILFKYLQKWKAAHEGKPPSNYRQKKEFKELIRGGIRSNEEGVPLEEENFDEAIDSVNSVLVPTSIPPTVQSILDDPACLSVTNSSSNFWLLTQALRDFISKEGHLPLRGSIPDMISSSDLYIDLQRLYQSKANSDIETLTSFLNHILVSVGKGPGYIPEEEIKRFCKNSSFLRLVRTTSLNKELTSPNSEELSHHLSDPDSDIVYYLLIRGADLFYSQLKSFPGSTTVYNNNNTNDSVDGDLVQFKGHLLSLLTDWGLSDVSILDDKITEFCRYGGGELHSVASYIGGVASQEVIKVITHQYVPINNTYIYNGLTSTSATVTL